MAEQAMEDYGDRFFETFFYDDNMIKRYEMMYPEVDTSSFLDGELPISSSDITDSTNDSTGSTSLATQVSKRCSMKSNMNYPFKSRKFENVMLCAQFENEFKPKIHKDAPKEPTLSETDFLEKLVLNETFVCPPQNNSVTMESGIDSTLLDLYPDDICCTFANCDNKRMYKIVNPSDVLPFYQPVLPVESEVRSAIQTRSPIQIRGTIADGETVIRDGSRTPDSAYISDYLTSPPLSNSSQASSSGDYIDVEGLENSQVVEHNYSITRGCPLKSQSVPTSPTGLSVSYSKSRCNSRAATSNRTPAQPGRKPKKEMSIKPTGGQRGKGRGRPNSKKVSDIDDLDKRQSHNFSERTRRSILKNRYDELKKLIPEGLCLPDTSKLGQSKVATLKRALVYVQQLENTDEKLQNELNFLQVENARLVAKWNTAINNRSFKQNYRH